jgi:hypothetical protein
MKFRDSIFWVFDVKFQFSLDLDKFSFLFIQLSFLIILVKQFLFQLSYGICVFLMYKRHICSD